MEQGSKKWVWVLAAVAVLLVAGWWMWQQSQQVIAPEIVLEPTLSEDDTTTTIEQELQAVDLGDIEKELQTTEADLQSL